ncbi:MAG: serine/threonine protein kinase [Deltaproteobacteria bacterium]|nr:serine/threonine protein kinase [Deltaproteobacteria bacterium]
MFGGLDILARLSTGGMGEVLLGRRRGALGFEKLLAIKTIRGDLVERHDFRAMFLDEARLVARLDHPTITQVFDFGEEGRSLFISMEYVAGVSLGQLLRAGRAPLPPGPSARMVAEVLRGLHFAHEATDLAGEPLGVVHRDVSPQNLIVTFDGRMKILDFGIAITKDRNAPDTQVGVLKGKPSYMAPEQLRGGAVDRRADVFSASVVLYEILTGRKLFTRETALATALAVEGDPFDPPSSFIPKLHPELDAIVLKGLARKPEERFTDARQMAEALERVAAEIAATTIQEFAELELAEEQAAHQRWLNEVLDRAELLGPEELGPSEAMREAALLVEGLPGPPPEARPHPPTTPGELIPSGGLRVSGDQTTVLPEIGRGSSPRAIVAALVFALAVVAGVAYQRFDRSAVVPEVRAEALPEVIEQVADATISIGLAPEMAALDAARLDEANDAEAEPVAPRASSARRRPSRASSRRDPPAREAASLETAFLTVGAEPYALVRIDGEDAGVTPIVRRKIPAGTHHIELLSPDTGEVRLKKQVKVDADEHKRITIP